MVKDVKNLKNRNPKIINPVITAMGNLIPILPRNKMNKFYSHLIQEKHIAHVLCVCHFRKLYGGPLSRDFIVVLNTSFTLKLKIRGYVILA